MNKRKVLDAARKYAQKGAKEKALKEYAVLLKEDSRDAKLLLEIGDAHRRWGQNEEAISHYVRVAEQYMQGGFDARAVAVFKQILNLDEKRYPAYVSLAELYQRMGLDSEAANALQTAADGYHKAGQKREALELLRKMATLDPTNTTSRIKVAELLRQEDLIAESVDEYRAVVQELVRQGASEELVPVYERILEMRPDQADIEFALARNLVQQGQPDRAEPFARRAFEHQKDGEGHFDLVCSIYSELERMNELVDVTKEMAQVYRARGDDDLARELMQRLPSDVALDVKSSDPAPSLDTGGLLGDDDFLDDDFLSTDGARDHNDDSFIDIGGEDDLDLDLASDTPAKAEVADSRGASGSKSVLPEGDPDQLFAEASVYVRYGKRDQAIASLEAILAQEPEHRDALEKIGECYADEGDSERAVAYWLEAASVARNAGDDESLDAFRERIAVLDPAAAENLVRSKSGHASSSASSPNVDVSAQRFMDDDEPEIDLDLDDEVSASPASATADDEVHVDVDIDVEIDMDIDVDIDVTAQDEVDAANPSHADESFDELSLNVPVAEDESGDSAGFSEGDVTENANFETSEGGTSAANSDAGGSSESEVIREELEEAEFYMEQQLFDEAEAIYERVLKISPKHPSALLRLGELRAARGEDPDSAEPAQSAHDEVTLDPADLHFEDADESSSYEVTDEFDGNDSPIPLGADSELEIAVELDVDFTDGDEVDAAAIDPDEIEVDDRALDENDEDVTRDASYFAEAANDVSSATSGNDGEYEVEIDFGAADDDSDVSVELAADDEDADSLHHDNTMPLYVDDADDDETPPHSVSAVVDQADDDDSFDLAAELRETLEQEDERDEQQAAQAQSEPTSEEDGFASIFKDFKSGVAKTLAKDDFETRFDLGIAYRGMELFDDALGEFQICLQSPGHKIESLHMMGLCAIDLGRFADAANHFEQALSTDELPTQKEAGLRFDLARSFEGLGDFVRAKHAFETAKQADATMPGIDKCIARVAAQITSAGSQTDADASTNASEGFENFDDLVAEVEAEDQNDVPVESFESFDDVVAEAEAGDVVTATETEPEVGDNAQSQEVVEARPEEPEPDVAKPESGNRKRKKKRISFV